MTSIVKRVTDVAARIVLKPATVGAVTEHGPFRILELTGARLVGADWSPGDKLRVRADDGFSLRTYTPMSWDRERGTTRVLSYLHGAGPGSDWSRRAQPGDPCELLGPDRSVRLDRLQVPPVFVGDETSFGLLVALCTSRPEMTPVVAALEVADERTATATLRALDVDDFRLFARAPGDAHLAGFAAAVVEGLNAHPGASFVISGRAQTIAAVRRSLNAAGATPSVTMVKAYWDVNRKGLD